ncbi:MAG TPA: hypothetical protein VMF59_06975 [Bacteroidota bacterium]|nr:hypothetical protein [Bacteroidota bacterium]
MRRIRGLLFLSAALALLQASCNRNDNPAGPDASGGTLSGIIRDMDGNPVQNVGVHYIFETNQIRPLSKPGGTCPSTQIEYTIPARGHVLIRILRWYTRQPIDTLVNGDLNAGTYSVGFNGGSLTNGVYICQIVTDMATRESTLTLLNADVNTLVLTEPLTTSNAQGEFSLPYGVFGFGVVIHVTSSSGPSVIDSVCISPSLQIVLYKEGYQIMTRPVTIDTTQALSIAFTMARQ